MTRYYVALQPPADRRNRLSDAMRAMGDPWPIPHVTVVAPPGLSQDLAWLPVVRDAARQCAPFDVTIGRSGTFANRVLYLAVTSPELLRLERVVRGDLLHLDPRRYAEDRPYEPHLTLARGRDGSDIFDHGELVATLEESGTFRVRELVVFHKDDPDGHYDVWARLPLSAARP
jgi:2'-5' RNA ligase